jgi:hypothetical protein
VRAEGSCWLALRDENIEAGCIKSSGEGILFSRKLTVFYFIILFLITSAEL